MTDYGKFYFDKLGKEIGIAKRLISAYSYERVIGASITRQGVPDHNKLALKNRNKITLKQTQNTTN